MIFQELEISGVYLVSLEPQSDQRGFFARTFCEREFTERGLELRIVQTNVSWNAKRGTLRGMHYQQAPSKEAKLVSCVRGKVFDAIIDLRAESPSFARHAAVELEAPSRQALYIPCGIAHGFQTLVDDTEMSYCMGDFFDPSLARGVRWNDPAFAIPWPLDGVIISERDRSYPDFDAQQFAAREKNAST